MIVDKKVEVKIYSKNVNTYKDKYKCGMGDIIYVDICEVSKQSHRKVTVACDDCGFERIITIQTHNRRDDYFCKNCIRKYMESPFSRADVREKIKKTKKERYGDENYNNNEKYKETCLKKYGADNAMKNEKNIEKLKKTNQERYGGNSPTQNEGVLKKRETTYLKKYGFITNLMCEDTKEKIKETNLERYGVENVSQNKQIKKKKMNTCLKNYGVDNPLKDPDIFMKQQISGYKCKIYKGVYYRGTYELDFLKKYSHIYDMINGKTIKYFFDEKDRNYHPDFFIEKFNLIIEIKSDYTYNKEFDMNQAKRTATLENGYNFIFVINKDYTELNKILEF